MNKTKLLSFVLAGSLTMGTAAYSVGIGTELVMTAEAAAGVDMWFDHVTVKTELKDTKSTGMTSYHMYMAKNEIEGCQFFVAPSENMDLNVSVTDFVNKDGATLETELYFEHYFNMAEGGYKMPDALPPVTKAISVKAGNSQGFYFKTKTALDTAAGNYIATVTVKSGDEIIKTAEVTLTVWDFELAEETPFDTAVNLGRSELAVQHKSDDVQALYENYYNFMLENRVSAYQLPYDVLSDEANEYMSNPRVTSFAVGGDSVWLTPSDDEIRQIYEKMQSNPEWAEKAYFYYVDEPTEMGKLNGLKAAGERLAELYPGYSMVSPFFYNINIGGGVDQFRFMSDYLGIWCTKINAWTPVDTTVEGAIHMMSQEQVALYGDYASRVAKEVEGGDKNWVYYCWEPLGPYTTFDASRQTLEQRVALWQAMDNDVTGFLYFASTLWSNGIWRTIHTTNAGGKIVYGDGLLLYPGAYPGAEILDGPISSMRFESLRDGIEDWMYLDMAKSLISKDIYESLMDNVTVSAVDWCKDSELFYDTRVALGNMIESALATDGAVAENVEFKDNSGFVIGDEYVGGAEPGTTAMTVLASLKNMNGVQLLRDGATLGINDSIKPGDVISLGEKNFTLIIKGSVNGDDKINLADASAMLQSVAGWNVVIDDVAADVDANGKVNLADVSSVLKKIAGWNIKFNMTPVMSGAEAATFPSESDIIG